MQVSATLIAAQQAARVKPEIGKARDEARHGIVQRDLALFHQHQKRHRGDGLGHGENAEDGVLAHRRLAGDVGDARHAEPGQRAFAPDHDQRAGNGAAFHIIVRDHVVKALKPVGVEAVCAHGHSYTSSPARAKGGL